MSEKGSVAANGHRGSDPMVAAIVVSYNGRSYLEACLDSLQAVAVTVKIYVIDNDSSDGSADFVAEHYPDVQVVRSDRNLGFGQANNLGLQQALAESCDSFLLLNQDAVLEPKCLQELIHVQQQQPDYGIISPMHLDGQGQVLDAGFARSTQYDTGRHLIADLTGALRGVAVVDSIYETDFVNAAAWLVSRDCLESVGGFDPLYFHYGEDEDYLHRVRYHDWKVGLCPLAVIRHDRPQFDRQMGRKRTFQQMSRRAMIEHLHRLKDPGRSQGMQMLNSTLRQVRDSLRQLLDRRIRAAGAGYVGWFQAIRRWKSVAHSRRVSWQRGPGFLKIVSETLSS